MAIATKPKKMGKRPPNPSNIAELLGLEEIREGIVRHHGRYLLILEIQPVNFRLKSEKEQEYVISCYEELLRVLKTDFQITTIARKADLDGHLRYMERFFKAEQDDNIKQQIAAYMEFSRQAAGKSAVSRRFILTIPYRPPAGVKPQEVRFAEAAHALSELKGQIRQILRKCQNELVEPENADRHVAEILYSLLNRQASESQSLPNLSGRAY